LLLQAALVSEKRQQSDQVPPAPFADDHLGTIGLACLLAFAVLGGALIAEKLEPAARLVA
jgi:hypothetical protein